MVIPIELSEQDIQELRTAHAEEFGEVLSDEQAREMGQRLLLFYGLVRRVDVNDHPACRPTATMNRPTNEVFRLHQKIIRDRGSPGSVNRIAET